MNNVTKLCTAFAMMATVILSTNPSNAQQKKAGAANCDGCTLEVKAVTEKKTCFKVEEKVICVPAVRMPWHKCDPPKTSKTKTIRVLKKETYERPSSSYEWTVAKAAKPVSIARKALTENKQNTESMPLTPQPPVLRASAPKLRFRK